jgi:zinc protease
MKSKTLQNNLTIIAHSDPKIKNAVVNVLYKVGSASEVPENTGLAHFLEHMAFEGSEKYPHFDELLNEMMGENNAFTTQDYTCYYESFPVDQLEEILNIEKDRIQNLTLNPKSIKLQRKVIEEEYKETSINPQGNKAYQRSQR